MEEILRNEGVELPHQRKRQGFGMTLDLDNEALNALKKPKQKHGKFVKFAFLDLNKVDEDDESYWNLAVRDEQNAPARIEAMQVSYNNYQWLYTEFPPCVGTDGKPRDGRTRILAAKRAGERWIIIAIFSYDETEKPTTDYISDSLSAQQRPASTGVVMGDLVAAGIACIDADECLPEKSAVETLVYNEFEAEKFFSNQGGTITKIVNQILNSLEDDGTSGGTTIRRSREEWEEWLDRAGHPKGTYILLSVDNPTYAMRAWCQHLLPFFAKKKKVANIILYTNQKTGERARQLVKIFMADLEYFYTASFAMVNNVQDIVEIKPVFDGNKKPKAYNVLGAIPQINDKHEVNSYKLVDIDVY